MHFALYQDVASKTGDSYPVSAGICAADVHVQMQILLYARELRWIPALGISSFLAQKDGCFVLEELTPQFYSAIFPSKMEFKQGQPLPHPVDNSFIFMMAKKVAKKIAQDRESLVKKRKEELGPGNIPKGYDPELVKYKAEELIGHILFQYLHVPNQELFPHRKFAQTAHYGNVPKEVISSCGLLVPNPSGKGLKTVSKEHIWNLSKKML